MPRSPAVWTSCSRLNSSRLRFCSASSRPVESTVVSPAAPCGCRGAEPPKLERELSVTGTSTKRCSAWRQRYGRAGCTGAGRGAGVVTSAWRRGATGSRRRHQRPGGRDPEARDSICRCNAIGCTVNGAVIRWSATLNRCVLLFEGFAWEDGGGFRASGGQCGHRPEPAMRHPSSWQAAGLEPAHADWTPVFPLRPKTPRTQSRGPRLSRQASLARSGLRHGGR